MKRLTERLSNGQAAVYGCGNNCKYDYKYCNNHLEDCPTINDIYEKLAVWEDLEEQLEKVYGECDGLLETVINHLLQHEGIDIGEPQKARLLTDEAVDEWEDYKKAKEQGLLLRLPCKCGDTVYTACSWGIESGVVGSIEIIGDMIFVNNPYRAMIGQAHNIFRTKEEAEQALTRMEKSNG